MSTLETLFKIEVEEVKPVIVVKEEEEDEPKKSEKEVKPESSMNSYEIKMSTPNSFVVPKLNFEEIEPSKVVKNVGPTKSRSYTTKCCVCGKVNQLHEMLLVPKQNEILVKLSLIFGPKFLETCTRNGFNRYVCSTFCNPENLEEPLPEPLKRMKKKSKNLQEAKSYTTKCCVCGKVNQLHEMLLVPKQNEILVEWSQLLGPKFLETCTRNGFNRYICSIHWKQMWENLKGPLPEPLEHMKNESIRESAKIEISKNIKYHTTFCWLENRRSTESQRKNKELWYTLLDKYCGVKCRRRYKTGDSSYESQLLKWRDSPRTQPFILQGFCAFCRKSKSYCDLTVVTRNLYDENDIELCRKIFGENFYRRALENRKTLVCQSHFDDAKKKSRPNGLTVQMLPNEVKENTFLSSEIKLEEPDINDNSDEKFHLSESSTEMKQENFFIQDEPSDPKRIKLEVKEEEPG